MLNEVAKQIQHCCSHLRTKENLKNAFNMSNSMMLNGVKWKCVTSLSEALFKQTAQQAQRLNSANTPGSWVLLRVYHANNLL